MRYLTIFFLFVCATAFSGTVESIEFTGLTRTKEDYLRKIITLEEKGEFSFEALDKDVFLLRNLNLFFEVIGSADSLPGDKYKVNFAIKEATYIYPIFSIGGFDDQLKIQAGANHINFLGKAQSFGALYQYYDRHSFSVFHTARRHANNRTGHEFALSKYSTIEPLYFQDTVSSFDFNNYSVSIGGYYWLGQYLNVNLGGMYMYEDYRQRDNAFPYNGRLNFHKHQLRTSLNFNKVEYLYERQEGYAGRAYGEWINTYETNDNPSFLKTVFEGRSYRLIGERGNWASRVRFGLSTNNFSPFAPFVLDGFINVRGIGNRTERGTAELIVNTEYRHTFWVHKWFTIQGALFADYGSLRPAGGKIVDLFPMSENNLFTGGGIRFHLNVLYRTSLRLDYSVSPFNPSSHGFTFGFGQFF